MKRTGEEHSSVHIPLAARIRPKTLEDFVGHVDVLGEDTVLYRAIQNKRSPSLILWGPPGVGKTTIAEIIAASLDASVERISAVESGVKDIRAALDRAAQLRRIGKPAVLIVDEIHRFTKSQQDVLLPAVEEGVVTLIGATTENPFFEVVAALVSRVEIVRLEGLSEDDIRTIVHRADMPIDKGAEDLIVRIAGSDARRALNILERACIAAGGSGIREEHVHAATQQQVVQYDKSGDAHYDTISAYIKSMRGSDPDAALFYLFRMLKAGEDPKYIVRRMYIFASEDIGNADPHALMLVDSAARALGWVGVPEAEYNLAHASVYLSVAPKSNSITVAMNRAKEDVEKFGNHTPPGHITNAPVDGMKQFGKGEGYISPHDVPGSVVKQQYRPDAVQDHVYYEPKEDGFEKQVAERLERVRNIMNTK